MEIRSNWGKILLVVLLATAGVVGVAVAGLVQERSAYLDYDDKLGTVNHHELEPVSIDPSWVLSGSPKFAMTVFSDAQHLGSFSGIWQATGPGKFVWKYNVDESIYILDGSVELEYMGKKLTLRPGDSTFFAAGTEATWTVRDHVRKTFRIYQVSRTTRLMRRLLTAFGAN
ncbi:MAG: cupin domain-containing protein [Burkholderiales bacterium]